MARSLIRGSLQIRAGTLVNSLWSTESADRLAESKVVFSTTTGHDHDGVNSKSVSGNAHTFDEIPGGTINGTNTAFTLAATPANNADVRVYHNGQRLLKGAGNDYTVSGTDITTLFVAETNDVLTADYLS